MHSDEFKADAVASCMQPGMSMAAVAMADGLNANLLRRWAQEAEMRHGAQQSRTLAALRPASKALAAAFVPMRLPDPSPTPDIRIELRRGATAISVSWSSEAASECAVWMRELLR